MARGFDDASSEYLETDSAPVTAYPFTMACWFNTDDSTAIGTMMSIVDKDATNDRVTMITRGDLAGDPIAVFVDAGSTSSSAFTTTGYTANTCAVGTFGITTSSFSGTNHPTNQKYELLFLILKKRLEVI